MIFYYIVESISIEYIVSSNALDKQVKYQIGSSTYEGMRSLHFSAVTVYPIQLNRRSYGL